jgi:hypothetical protein
MESFFLLLVEKHGKKRKERVREGGRIIQRGHSFAVLPAGSIHFVLNYCWRCLKCPPKSAKSSTAKSLVRRSYVLKGHVNLRLGHHTKI